MKASEMLFYRIKMPSSRNDVVPLTIPIETTKKTKIKTNKKKKPKNQTKPNKQKTKKQKPPSKFEYTNTLEVKK